MGPRRSPVGYGRKGKEKAERIPRALEVWDRHGARDGQKADTGGQERQRPRTRATRGGHRPDPPRPEAGEDTQQGR